jgi:FkbM family methyltransferase
MLKTRTINSIFEDIRKSEKEIFTNGEHYNEMGFSTRKKILELALNIENGFFVEVGACMGTDTKLLEACGWNGLLVEPSEGLYQFCKNTRNCIVENYALVSENYKENTISNLPVFSLPTYLEGYPSNSGLYKTITFTTLVKIHNIKKIDIFVLDVEGLEIEILNGINFDEVDISNFIIEWNVNAYSLETLDTLMSSKGYKNMGVVEHLGELQSDYHYKKI